eukprot:PhM_4_TR2137/c2_g1_i1/m.54160
MQEGTEQTVHLPNGVSLALHAFEKLAPSDALALLTGDDNTGIMLWNGSRVLASLLTQIETRDALLTINGVRPDVVCELGGGVGLVSLALSTTTPTTMCSTPINIICTDGNPECVDMMHKNFARNSACSSHNCWKLTAEVWRWGDAPLPSPVLGLRQSQKSSRAIVILAADALYELGAVPVLISGVTALVAGCEATAARFVLCHMPRLWDAVENEK